MFYRKIKYIFFGIFLLFLFHFETLSLGPIKVSHLWKGGLLLFLVFNVLINKRKRTFIYMPLIWLSIFQLINIELLNNPSNAFFLFFTTLIMSLLGIYLLKFSTTQLENGLLFFASFFILSFIPYELGLLESLGKEYTLSSYGVEQLGIVGPFQRPHAASTALAGSFLVVLYFWFLKTFNRLYLSILLIICFYFLLSTYVRTGMLMVIIGMIPLLKYFSKKNLSTRIRLFFIGGVFSILISGWVLSNEVLMDRITGKRLNKQETESFEDLGSGRGLIYIYSFDIFNEANVFEKIIGLGQTEQVKRMEKKLGKGLIPHNGFLLILLNTGILGLIIFIAFFIKIYNFYKSIRSLDKVLLKGLFFAYIVMTFFQNYDILYEYLLLVLSITYSFKIKEQTNVMALND